MVAITIKLSDDIAARIREAARQANLSVEDYAAQQLIEGSQPPPPLPPDAAKRANIIVSDPTISARSREIIEEEMEKHLIRELEEDDPTR
jgi:hypothetical protein